VLSQSEKARHTAKMASVSAEVLRRSGEEEGNNAHMEQEMLVDPAQHGAGSVPAADSAANIPKGHNRPRGEQPEHSEEEIRNQSDVPRNAVGSGGPDRSASPPGGGGYDRCHRNNRQTKARERAITKALDLIEEAIDVLQLADGHPAVLLVGQST
jgi:hypothetical protein